jgi:hypothetical protein
MKRNLPAIWLALGLVLIGFHFLQGRKIEARETAEFIRQAATQAELNGKHEVALSKFTEALKSAETLDPSLQLRLQLDVARVRIQTGESLEAAESLDSLLDRDQLKQMPASLVRETRALAASAHYYAAYALRLENAPRDMWLDEIERSRQHFRNLTEGAVRGETEKEGDAYGRALEAAILLERAGVYELNAKEVPQPCENARRKGIFKKKCDSCDKKNGKQPDEEKEENTRKSMKRFATGQGS